MPCRDVNSVILTGTVETAPSYVTISSGKRILLFTFLNCEYYEYSDGTPARHDNFLAVEVLGKNNIDKYMKTLKPGDWYQLSGYLRVDEINGREMVRVRAFRIDPMEVPGGNG